MYICNKTYTVLSESIYIHFFHILLCYSLIPKWNKLNTP